VRCPIYIISQSLTFFVAEDDTGPSSLNCFVDPTEKYKLPPLKSEQNSRPKETVPKKAASTDRKLEKAASALSAFIDPIRLPGLLFLALFKL
jgi:hypothetical protein